MSTKFESLGLSAWITRQVAKLGLKSPTIIQEKCIPEILNGNNCLGQAKTGSGKTFAFALPILEKLGEEPRSFFALVLTPTHELAQQIAEQFTVAGYELGVRVCVISGGTDQILESQKLQSRPHIIVAMPGRLADHLSGCNTIPLDGIQFLVIDEADRVLSGSFDEALSTIERFLPKKRQNLFFSATLNEKFKNNSIFPMPHNLFEWSNDDDVATVDTLDQRYVLCADYDRDIMMIEVLTKFKSENEKSSVIIFTNTKKDCQLLSLTLNSIDMKNVCLHGFMRQKERVAALSSFRSKQVDILIATDVASRGLDIPNVALVLNHQLPRFPNEYIHRVGRTARQGRDGIAISIFRFPRDLKFLAQIESIINTKLVEHKVDQHSVEKIFVQVNVAKREAEMKLDNKDFGERINNYRKKKWIAEGLDPEEEEQKLQRIKDERERRAKKNIKTINPKITELITTDNRFKTVKLLGKKKKVNIDVNNKKRKTK